MTIEHLIKAVPPPVAPFDAFEGHWGSIETAVGTSLPPDFKDFARLYGDGCFMGFMGMPVPRSSDRGVKYARWVGEVCRTFQHLSLPHPVWPEAGGLFPLAWVEDGDQLFWLTRGPPETWRVAVWDRSRLERDNIEIFDCDVTDFLAGLATGEIAPQAFPDDLRYCDHLFQPSKA